MTDPDPADGPQDVSPNPEDGPGANLSAFEADFAHHQTSSRKEYSSVLFEVDSLELVLASIKSDITDLRSAMMGRHDDHTATAMALLNATETFRQYSAELRHRVKNAVSGEELMMVREDLAHLEARSNLITRQVTAMMSGKSPLPSNGGISALDILSQESNAMRAELTAGLADLVSVQHGLAAMQSEVLAFGELTIEMDANVQRAQSAVEVLTLDIVNLREQGQRQSYFLQEDGKRLDAASSEVCLLKQSVVDIQSEHKSYAIRQEYFDVALKESSVVIDDLFEKVARLNLAQSGHITDVAQIDSVLNELRSSINTLYSNYEESTSNTSVLSSRMDLVGADLAALSKGLADLSLKEERRAEDQAGEYRHDIGRLNDLNLALDRQSLHLAQLDKQLQSLTSFADKFRAVLTGFYGRPGSVRYRLLKWASRKFMAR